MTAQHNRHTAEQVSLQEIVAALAEIDLRTEQSMPGIRFGSIREEKLERNFRRAIAKGGCFGRYNVQPTRRGFFVRKYVAQVAVGNQFESLIDTSDIDGRPVGANTVLTAVQVNANEVVAQTESGVKYRFPIAQVTFQMQQVADAAAKQAPQSLPDTVTPQEVGETRKAQLNPSNPGPNYPPRTPVKGYENLRYVNITDPKLLARIFNHGGSTSGFGGYLTHFDGMSDSDGMLERAQREISAGPVIAGYSNDDSWNPLPLIMYCPSFKLWIDRYKRVIKTQDRPNTVTSSGVGETRKAQINPKHKLGHPTRLHCDQCEALAINGVATHETGCPNSHIDLISGKPHKIECFECGYDYTPEGRVHRTNAICPDCRSTREGSIGSKKKITSQALATEPKVGDTVSVIKKGKTLVTGPITKKMTVGGRTLYKVDDGNTYEFATPEEIAQPEAVSTDKFVPEDRSNEKCEYYSDYRGAKRNAQADDSGALNDYSCPGCKGPGVLLKDKGQRVAFRCRDCRTEYEKDKAP